MKIQAIRGQNLASLGGEFAVEFTASPLDRSGLFAITGPTGAGKSTILDALCLALYGKTPRLNGRSSVRVKRPGKDGYEEETVGEQDPRSILRHGCNEGFAEVDFVGFNGRSYRSRWAVRRAGRKGVLKFQEISITLSDLAEERPLGGKTKTEVFDEIQRLLGLSFEQFRRAVLLAQGDFAAFLKANAKDRSELLQAITGTDIYKRVGRGAFERAKVEREALRQIEDRLATTLPLDLQQRADLERQTTEERNLLEGGCTRLEKLKAELNWYVFLAELLAREDTARKELAAAETAEKEGAERQATLARVERVQPLRGVLEQYDRALREIDSTEKAIRENAEKNIESQHCATARRDEMVQAKHLETSIREEHEAAGPVLQHARITDAAIGEQKKVLAACQQKAVVQQATVSSAKETLDAQVARKTLIESGLTETMGWLEKNRSLESSATDWKLVKTDLIAFDGEHVALTTTRSNLQKLQEAIAEVNRELVEKNERHGILVEALKTSQVLLVDLERQVRESDLEQIGARRDEFQRLEKEVSGLSDLCGKGIEWCAKHAESLDEAHTSSQQQIVETEKLADLKKVQVKVTVELEKLEREEHDALMTLSKDVVAMREQLQAGHPCPVCGSESHPWHDRKPVADKAVKKLSAQVKALRLEEKECSEKIAEVQATLKALEKETKKAKKQLTEGETIREQISREWTTLRSSDELPATLFQELPTDDGRGPAFSVAVGVMSLLDERRKGIETALKAVKKSEKAAHTVRKNFEAARTESQKQDAEKQGLEKELNATHLVLQGKTQEMTSINEQIGAAEKRLDDLRGRLAPHFEGSSTWMEKLNRDPRAFLRDHEKKVTEYLEVVQKRDALTRDHQEIAPVLSRLEAEFNAADALAKQVASTVRLESEKLESLVKERATLLGGQPADAFEASLKLKQTEAQIKVEAGQQALLAIEKALDELRVHRVNLEGTLEKYRLEHQQCRAALQEQLAAMHADLECLRTWLGFSAEWMTQERAALDALAVRRVQAHTRVESNRNDLERHRAGNPPQGSEEALRAELPALQQTIEDGQTRLADLRGRISLDDEKRKKQADEVIKRDQQRAITDLWEKMRELIGDADGSKFNKFAQNITFDVLVQFANIHLDELSHRYRLQRIPDSDLELQLVDRELGDEIRSVHGLSGGESFIVSLSLALGLASLSSEKTRVESLFIDEGFGTLDPETLDTVLAGLDSLQAGGRTIGIISHVRTLIERIGVQVEIVPSGNGRSFVNVSSGVREAVGVR